MAVRTSGSPQQEQQTLETPKGNAERIQQDQIAPILEHHPSCDSLCNSLLVYSAEQNAAHPWWWAVPGSLSLSSW